MLPSGLPVSKHGLYPSSYTSQCTPPVYMHPSAHLKCIPQCAHTPVHTPSAHPQCTHPQYTPPVHTHPRATHPSAHTQCIHPPSVPPVYTSQCTLPEHTPIHNPIAHPQCIHTHPVCTPPVDTFQCTHPQCIPPMHIPQCTHTLVDTPQHTHIHSLQIHRYFLKVQMFMILKAQRILRRVLSCSSGLVSTVGG